MLDLKEVPGGVLLKVRLQPRASKNEVCGLHGDALKVRLTAPPVEGEANRACVQFVAELVGVPRGQVEITSGHKSRDKTLKISGTDKETVGERLKRHL